MVCIVCPSKKHKKTPNKQKQQMYKEVIVLGTPLKSYTHNIPVTKLSLCRAVARHQKWRRRNLLAYPEYPHGHCVFLHSRIFAFLPRNQRRRPLPQPGYGPFMTYTVLTLIYLSKDPSVLDDGNIRSLIWSLSVTLCMATRHVTLAAADACVFQVHTR